MYLNIDGNCITDRFKPLSQHNTTTKRWDVKLGKIRKINKEIKYLYNTYGKMSIMAVFWTMMCAVRSEFIERRHVIKSSRLTMVFDIRSTFVNGTLILYHSCEVRSTLICNTNTAFMPSIYLSWLNRALNKKKLYKQIWIYLYISTIKIK